LAVAGFALEGLGVLGELLGKELKGNGSAELRVFGLVNDAHAAAAKFARHAIVGDVFSDHGSLMCRDRFAGEELFRQTMRDLIPFELSLYVE
jgi:hypothetical protein